MYLCYLGHNLSKIGQHIQFNLVDTEELFDAKAHPEKHRDLVVRVGGFSACFIMLSPEIHDGYNIQKYAGLLSISSGIYVTRLKS